MAVPAYDTVEQVVTAARIRLNDAIASAGGDVLTDNASFTIVAINNAWRRQQEFVAASNAPRLTNNVILTGLGAAVSNDPSITAQLNWTGFTPPGGSQNTSIVLPQDMIFPLRLWERPNGSNLPFTPMEYAMDGLQDVVRQPRNQAWEFRNDAIYMPGTTGLTDIRIRYAAYLADFVANSTTAFTAQTVPIMRALDSLAWYICSEMANARGDVDGKEFDTKAESAAKLIIDRATRIAALRSQWSVPDIPAAPVAGHYDTVGMILDAVRVRLNKANTLAGDLIIAANPFTQRYFNTGYRRFQEFLANLGYIRLTDEVIITNLPVVTSLDPAAQVALSWAGYFDGSNLQPTPALPDSVMFPLKIWERQTGSNASFPQGTMENMLDGLNGGPHLTRNAQWEWRSDQLVMPGATAAVDLRIRFSKYLPDFVQVGSTPWYLQTVPVVRCLDPLSLYVCAEVAFARPDLELDPILLKEAAEESAKLIFNRDVRAKQRVNARRQSRSGRLEGAGYSDYGLVQ